VCDYAHGWWIFPLMLMLFCVFYAQIYFCKQNMHTISNDHVLMKCNGDCNNQVY
jgi:hypothetical protein